jgi:hypothetical protein
LVYRSVDHAWLRSLCEDLRKSTLAAKYAPHVPAGGLGPNIIAFATAVLELQQKRHSADYDPMIRVKSADAVIAARTARAAVARFGAANATEREAFLSLLAFPPRR